jgi:hypothetical protein
MRCENCRSIHTCGTAGRPCVYTEARRRGKREAASEELQARIRASKRLITERDLYERSDRWS